MPGGVARDIAAGRRRRSLHALLAEVRRVFPRLIELYDNTASLQDRTVTTGIVKPEYARQFGAGGYVGRASGRDFDARRTPGYAPYDELTFDVPVLDAGDVNARVWIRIREVEQSLALIDQILGRLPAGEITTAGRSQGQAGEGMALVEAFRGDVLVWLRLDDARPRRALPSARCVLVPMAAAGSRGRRQHRRRLPALQQIVQLLLFGARPLMRKTLFESLIARPAHRAAARARRGRRSPSWRKASTAPRARGSAARCRSARSMPAPATAANWKSMR